jgi:leader peptidase (prepilin peptidase) / N-methyltransferase
MKKAFFKTFDRTRSFVLDGLNWRGTGRPYAVVVWGLLAGLVWIALDLSFGSSVTTGPVLLKLALLAILTVVAAIDARFGIIPDRLSVMLLIAGALNVLLENSAASATLTANPTVLAARMSELDAICWRAMEALMAVLGVMLLRMCYRFVRSRDGLGLGDVKFIGAAVLWVGLPMVPLMLIVAVGSALATIMLLRKQVGGLNGSDAIPFGPHLALGLWLTVLLGAQLSA